MMDRAGHDRQAGPGDRYSRVRGYLVHDPERRTENQFRLVMPSRTQIVGAQIRDVTRAGRPLHLAGHVMGGGASTEAVAGHVAAGLPVTATTEAAQTIHNNPARVAERGVKIVEQPPADSVTSNWAMSIFHLLSKRWPRSPFRCPGDLLSRCRTTGWRVVAATTMSAAIICIGWSIARGRWARLHSASHRPNDAHAGGPLRCQ